MLSADELVEAPYVGTDNQLPPDAYELQGCMPALVVKHIETLAQAKDASLVKRGDGVLTVDEIHAAVRVSGLDPDEFDQRVALFAGGVVTKEWVAQTLQLRRAEVEAIELLRAPPSAVADRVAEFARVYNAHSGRTLPAGVEGVSSLAVVMEGIEHPLAGCLRARRRLTPRASRRGAAGRPKRGGAGPGPHVRCDVVHSVRVDSGRRARLCAGTGGCRRAVAKTYIEAETRR